MCDTVLAFGDKGSFHFECPSRWVQKDLPEEINALFTECVVATSYHMSLGFNGGFIFSYKTKAGKDRLTSKNIPESLRTWLYEEDSDGDAVCIKKVYVSLGPDGISYWATDGNRTVWNGLPPDLAKAISGLLKDGAWTDKPRLVTLGFGGDYFMLTESNACHWKLSHYEAFNSILPNFVENKTLKTIVNISLSPHKADMCAGVVSSGVSFAEAMPASVASDMAVMEKAIREDTETMEHEKKLQDMKNTQREIELNDQATRIADNQTRFMQESMNRLQGFGYRCTVCYGNSQYCTCRGNF